MKPFAFSLTISGLSLFCFAHGFESSPAGTPSGETGIPAVIENGSPNEPAPEFEPIDFTIKGTVSKKIHVKEAPELAGLPAVEGSINVTVQRVEDPGLPDPLPSLPLDVSDPTVVTQLQELRTRFRETQILFVSATVYDHNRTFIRIHPNGRAGNVIEGWSNIDFGHFCGFGGFRVRDTEAQEGAQDQFRDYALIMGIGFEDTHRIAVRAANLGKEYSMPASPELPDLAAAGPAFVLTGGGDAEAIQAAGDMHEFYRGEGKRMEAATLAREKAYEERKAYLLANPPKPQDVTMQFWKRTAPTPAAIEQIKKAPRP